MPTVPDGEEEEEGMSSIASYMPTRFKRTGEFPIGMDRPGHMQTVARALYQQTKEAEIAVSEKVYRGLGAFAAESVNQVAWGKAVAGWPKSKNIQEAAPLQFPPASEEVKSARQEGMEKWRATAKAAPPQNAPWWQASMKGMATQKLGLNEQEQFLYQHHLDNLRTGGTEVFGKGKGISTILGETAEIDGKHYIVPTIWNNQRVTVNQGIENMMKTGLDKYPSYDSDVEAENRYSEMHEYMNKDIPANK